MTSTPAVPKLDHEIQFESTHKTIMSFLNGDIDYINCSAIPYKERLNIFFIKRAERKYHFMIGTFGGDILEDSLEIFFIDYDNIKTQIFKMFDRFEKQYGPRTAQTMFVCVGGKDI